MNFIFPTGKAFIREIKSNPHQRYDPMLRRRTQGSGNNISYSTCSECQQLLKWSRRTNTFYGGLSKWYYQNVDFGGLPVAYSLESFLFENQLFRVWDGYHQGYAIIDRFPAYQIRCTQYCMVCSPLIFNNICNI